MNEIKSKMENLFDQLIPEVKKLLEADTEQYPFLIKKMKTEMSKHYFPTDLTVNTAQTLVGYFDLLGLKAEYNSFLIKLYAVFGK